MKFDLIISGGMVVDGTGASRQRTDIGIANGVISAIGDLSSASASNTIDASGQIVAPGVIDLHTHYDAQLHWDPYCTSSCWHGTTTVLTGNCGFGYSPCHPDQQDRYMSMMENTEQVPFTVQKTALTWDWETFPEWMAHLKKLPKGVNVGAYLPMNPLLVYVMGADVKTRPADEAERTRMRELMNEALDAGASGFAFSLLGSGNGHVDHDGTPVPTDIMDPEEAYNLAQVLRDRQEGIIQVLVEGRQVCNREVGQKLAEISRRPIIYNAITAFDAPPDSSPEVLAIADRWQESIAWSEELEKEGLEVYLQAVTVRGWVELKIEDATIFNSVPVLSEIHQCSSVEELTTLISDPEYRQRAHEAYQPEHNVTAGGGFPAMVVGNAHGSEEYTPFEGQRVGDIAKALDKPELDVFFDILLATEMQVDFRLNEATSRDPNKIETLARHRRVIPGTSDGGAHVKMFQFGNYSTDLINLLVREEGRMTLEEVHSALSWRPARAARLHKRGALLEEYAADIIVYDYDKLTHATTYEVRNDLPNEDWRRVLPAEGMSYVLVNGEVICDHGELTNKHPGRLISTTSIDPESLGQSGPAGSS